MGAVQFSSMDIKDKVKQTFNSTISEEINQQIDVIMEGSNEIILEGYSTIEDLNINQNILIKNQVVADLIVDTARKYGLENNITNEVDSAQSSGDGIFALNIQNKALKKELEKYMNITDISKRMQSIRSQFSVSNKIKIINGKLETTGTIKKLNINQTNTSYNNATYKYLTNKLSEFEDKSQISGIINDTQQGADYKPILIVGIIVAGLVVYNLLK